MPDDVWTWLCVCVFWEGGLFMNNKYLVLTSAANSSLFKLKGRVYEVEYLWENQI